MILGYVIDLRCSIRNRYDAMGCRNDPDDPRKCERCGAFLWVADEGLYCGDCGVVMPCTMRLLPFDARNAQPH
ncbi:MAG TPA: hypothetical protein VEK13_06370 [Thermoplasmata archaeon]|nr:hypothetical protein [Thermoplasmata archaeon]